MANANAKIKADLESAIAQRRTALQAVLDATTADMPVVALLGLADDIRDECAVLRKLELGLSSLPFADEKSYTTHVACLLHSEPVKVHLDILRTIAPTDTWDPV